MLVLTSTVSGTRLVADGGYMCLGREKEQAAGEVRRTHSLSDDHHHIVSSCHLELRAVSGEEFDAKSFGMNGTFASCSGHTPTKLTKGEWVRLAAGTTLTLGPAQLKAKPNPFSFVVTCGPAPAQAAPEATRLSTKRPASPPPPADAKRPAAGSGSTSREPTSAAEAAEAAAPPPTAEPSAARAEAAVPPPHAEPSRLPYAFRLTPVAAGWGLPGTPALNAEALGLRNMLSEAALRGATEVRPHACIG